MKDRKQLNIQRATPIRASDLLQSRVADGSNGLLEVFEPSSARTDLAQLLGQRKAEIAQRLHDHGALLFRGFEVSDTEQFQRAIRAFSDDLLDYSHRSTPRTRLTGKIYTSTEYPPDQVIPLHNELSWTTVAPRNLWFCCLVPASTGGATPIADSRRVYELLPDQLRAKFIRYGILYVRNYHPEVDLSWQDVFDTDSKDDVARYCTTHGITFEWITDTHLRTQQHCHAVLRHPETGAPSWFNQAHLFHYTRVGRNDAEALLKMFGKDHLPRNTYFGNGEDITEEALHTIRSAYDEALVRFQWERGDVLLIDNIACAHARDTYQGDRKVIVAMAGAIDCVSLSASEGATGE